MAGDPRELLDGGWSMKNEGVIRGLEFSAPCPEFQGGERN